MTSKTNSYLLIPNSSNEIAGRIEDALGNGHISDAVADALHVLLYHQMRVDFDGLAEEYHNGSELVRQLIVDCGGVILMSPEQVKLLKFGA